MMAVNIPKWYRRCCNCAVITQCDYRIAQTQPLPEIVVADKSSKFTANQTEGQNRVQWQIRSNG